MKTLLFKNGKPFIQNDTLTKVLSQAYYDVQMIHVNHTHEDYKGFKDEIYNTYVVIEYFSNFSRLHLVSSSSKDEAMQFIFDYLIEEEEIEPEEIQLLHVEKINTNF